MNKITGWLRALDSWVKVKNLSANVALSNKYPMSLESLYVLSDKPKKKLILAAVSGRYGSIRDDNNLMKLIATPNIVFDLNK